MVLFSSCLNRLQAPSIQIYCSRINGPMDYQRVGLAIVLSHAIRSITGWDHRDDLALEITLIRSEVSKAESTIQRTSVILEHCNTYSNFLTYIVKVLAFSELIALIGVLFLLVSKRVVNPTVRTLTDRPVAESSSSESAECSDGSPEVSALIRAGPTRPSDLQRRRTVS